MKKVLFQLIISAAVIAIFINVVSLPYSQNTKFLYYSLCDTPIHYHIDTVDPKFGLSEEAFAQDVKEAATIWDNVENKNLFIYDPAGKLSINLIYDQRQSLSNQITSLQSQVQTQENNLKPSLADYQKQISDFNQKLADLNSQIDSWNSKGGAPKDIFDKLTQQENDIKAEADRLNQMGQTLNQSTQVFNSNINRLNQTVNTFNQELAQKPEEGIYDPNANRIEIYFNISKNELIHTIEHELGHSLGLGHIQNKNAIMYSFTNQQIIPSADDIAALNQICQHRSYFDLYMQKLNFVINQAQKNLGIR